MGTSHTHFDLGTHYVRDSNFKKIGVTHAVLSRKMSGKSGDYSAVNCFGVSFLSSVNCCCVCRCVGTDYLTTFFFSLRCFGAEMLATQIWKKADEKFQ